MISSTNSYLTHELRDDSVEIWTLVSKAILSCTEGPEICWKTRTMRTDLLYNIVEFCFCLIINYCTLYIVYSLHCTFSFVFFWWAPYILYELVKIIIFMKPMFAYQPFWVQRQHIAANTHLEYLTSTIIIIIDNMFNNKIIVTLYFTVSLLHVTCSLSICKLCIITCN